MSTLDWHRRAFEYELWATRRTVVSLERSRGLIEASGRASHAAPFTRAAEIFAHVQAARRVWLSRLAPRMTGPPESIFPVITLEESVREADALGPLWGEFLSELTEEGLDERVVYTSTDGGVFSNTVAEVLGHVVNHSSYHRGQIAMLVATTGAEPAVTDWIYRTREQQQA